MKLRFTGAAREVGKSCVELESNSSTIFLDCGLKMAGGDVPTPTAPPLEKMKRPSAVLLSHSHLDHCGAIPELYKHSAPLVYATTPTIGIANILYEDTIKIAKQENLPAPFSKADLQKAMKYFSALGYGNEFSLNNIKFSFHDAGHILGSAQILLHAEKKKILYTGDFKLKETRMHRGAEIVKENVDLLIIESTYADHEQPDRQKLEKQFFDEVQTAVDNGSTVLLPSFAVGRTQEILSILHERNLKGKIYIKGMGTKANELYEAYSSYIRDAKSFKAALKKAKIIETRKDREEALGGGNVIISTAGMLEGGPALGYIADLQKRQRAVIFLTGFQVPGTNGWKLLKSGEITLKDFKTKRQTTLDVRLKVKQFEFSAHAGWEELYEFVKKINPARVACVHGDEGSCESFAQGLREEGFDAFAPKLMESVEV